MKNHRSASFSLQYTDNQDLEKLYKCNRGLGTITAAQAVVATGVPPKSITTPKRQPQEAGRLWKGLYKNQAARKGNKVFKEPFKIG